MEGIFSYNPSSLRKFQLSLLQILVLLNPNPTPRKFQSLFFVGEGGGAGGLDYVRYFLKLHSVIYNFCFWFLICKFFSNLRGDKNKHRPPNFFNFLGNQIVHDRFSCDFVVSILCLPNFIGRCFSYFIVGNA